MAVELMTFDLVQGHVIQYARLIHFQCAKINILFTISPKILEIYAHLCF